jgi:hypothetical protein
VHPRRVNDADAFHALARVMLVVSARTVIKLLPALRLKLTVVTAV